MAHEDTPCWLWPATKQSGGYGQVGDGELAHRRAYRAYVGEIPDGWLVLHHCDTPLCVNPFHLFIGTHHDNNHDMIAKGRDRFRGNLGNQKLTQDDVRTIKARINLGHTQQAIAESFGIDQSTVSNIVTGKRWGGVSNA